jgi:hypothetical protein
MQCFCSHGQMLRFERRTLVYTYQHDRVQGEGSGRSANVSREEHTAVLRQLERARSQLAAHKVTSTQREEAAVEAALKAHQEDIYRDVWTEVQEQISVATSEQWAAREVEMEQEREEWEAQVEAARREERREWEAELEGLLEEARAEKQKEMVERAFKVCCSHGA